MTQTMSYVKQSFNHDHKAIQPIHINYMLVDVQLYSLLLKPNLQV